MSSELGFEPHRRLIPRSRALVCDVLRIFRSVPTTAHSRSICLEHIEFARQQTRQRVSWAAIFIKSYSAVCARHPKLCQSWVTWPFAHIIQHRAPVATVAVHREYDGDDWLLWGKVRTPHQCSLLEIQADLDRLTSDPVEVMFRQQLQLSMVPSLLRRMIWWWNLNLSGEKRAKRLGTFLLTTVAGRGAEIDHPPGFLTTSVTYGPLNADGQSRVTLVYDHRLMDGSFIAERLAELDQELNTTILSELEELSRHLTLPAEAA